MLPSAPSSRLLQPPTQSLPLASVIALLTSVPSSGDTLEAFDAFPVLCAGRCPEPCCCECCCPSYRSLCLESVWLQPRTQRWGTEAASPALAGDTVATRPQEPTYSQVFPPHPLSPESFPHPCHSHKSPHLSSAIYCGVGTKVPRNIFILVLAPVPLDSYVIISGQGGLWVGAILVRFELIPLMYTTASTDLVT